MTGDLKCPACERWGFSSRERSCTGRPGCVQHPNRETPAPDSAPAGPHVPDGKTDIVERAIMDGSVTVKQRALVAAHAEIARLRAEVEGWRVIASENHAALAAMRNDINEIVPMQSEEADLLNGPELSVWCATVVAAVRAEVERLTAERDEAKAHHVQWVAEVDADLTEIEANMDQQDAEIARLRAENERLTAIVTDDNGPWRLEAAKKRIAELEAEIARLTEERDEALKRKET